MRRGAGIALVLPVIGALCLAPSAATAKKKKHKSPPVTVVTNTLSTSSDNQQLTVTATCPAGKLAVGGGFQAPLSTSGSTLLGINLVYESRRAGESSWQASVVREDSGGPGPDVPVTASVDCRSPKLKAKKKSKKKKKLRITEVSASQTTPAASGAIADVTATCPTGRTTLGGGFSSSPRPDFGGIVGYPVYWASYRSAPNGWRSAFTNAQDIARTDVSYAYCAKGLKIAETSGAATLAPSSMAGISTATATTPSCTKGRALLGGGFNNTPAGSGGAIAFPTGSAAAGGTWQAGAFNFSTSPATLGSLGYCA